MNKMRSADPTILFNISGRKVDLVSNLSKHWQILSIKDRLKLAYSQAKNVFVMVSKTFLIARLTPRLHPVATFVIVSLLTFTFTIILMPIAQSQTPLLPLSNNISNHKFLINSGNIGNMVYAPVKLDGRTLFPIAAEAATGENMSMGNLTPIQSRIQLIENTLYQFIRRGFDPKTLKINVVNHHNQTVIFAADENQFTEAVPLFPLTEMDARIGGFTLSESANNIADITKNSLILAWQERQPEYLRHQVFISLGITLGMIISSLVLILLQKRTKNEWQTIKKQKQNLDVLLSANNQAQATMENPDEMATESSEFNVVMEQQMTIDRQLNSNSLKRNLLQIGLMLVWVGGIAWILGLFPYTRWLQIMVLTKPLILGIIIATNLAIKYSSVLIDYILNQWINHQRQSLSQGQIQRWNLRICSFAPMLKMTINFVLVSIGLILVLANLNIPVGPLLASAGILGFAISLGAQTLIKDLINGTFILIEDQYAIGDFVILGDIFGRVERMNIRTTSLRNKQGNLIIIPNSDIRIVWNLSKDWARTKLFIYVAYETDIDHATAVINKVAKDLMNDSFWGPQIIEAEVRGVEEVDAGGITIGFRIETKPGLFRKVAREFRHRMKLAFDREGISMGIPKYSLWPLNPPTNIKLH